MIIFILGFVWFAIGLCCAGDFESNKVKLKKEIDRLREINGKLIDINSKLIDLNNNISSQLDLKNRIDKIKNL